MHVRLHSVILYVPFLTHVFSTAPLNADEWMAVLLLSAPVIVLDEVLKVRSRSMAAAGIVLHHRCFACV